MRKNIFGVYKALRHFGVTPYEVEYIAHAYKRWYEDQHDDVPPLYGMVYSAKNRLISLPYRDEKLEKLFVGIEINGVVYFAHYVDDVRYDELENRIQELKTQISSKFDAFWFSYFSSHLRMPSRDEVKLLVENTKGVNGMGSVVCNKSCNVWITPDEDHPSNKFVTVNECNVSGHRASDKTQAVLYLVAAPSDMYLFIGEVNDYGLLTPETDQARRQLRLL